MALDSVVTAFTWNTAATVGTAIDVPCGFTPKLVILFCTGVNSSTDTVARDANPMMVGVGSGSADRKAVVSYQGDAATSADIQVGHTDIGILTLSNATHGRLDIDTEANWPANNIRFIVDVQLNAFYGNVRVSLLAIGGDDLTEAKTFTFQEPGASGAQAVPHGLGGVPTGAMFVSCGFATVAPAFSTTLGMLSVGFTDGTDAFVCYLGGDDANTTITNVGYAKTGELVAMGAEPAITLTGRATIASVDATNINLTWAERAATRYIHGIAWRGGPFNVGSTTTATNTTPFNGPTAGFIPKAAFFASACRAASTADTPTAHAMLSLGAATSASARIAQAMLDENAVGTSEVTTALETDAVYVKITLTSTIDALMDVADMTTDPMSLVMDDAEPTVGSFVGVAMWGDSVSAGAALQGTAALILTTASALETAIRLTGTASATVTVTSTLATAIRFTGASTLTVTTAGTLTTGIALAGTATLTLSSSSALTTAIPLSGSAALTVTAAGVVTFPGAALVGTASLSLTTASVLTTAIPLTGTANVALTASSALTTAIQATGIATLALTASSTLTTAIRLAGTAQVAITATAAMEAVGAALTGTASLALTGTSTLTTAIRLTGAATATVTTAGSLTTAIRCTGTATLVVTASGALEVLAAALTGTATLRLTGASTLTTAIALQGAASLVVTSTAIVTTAIRLSGTATLVMTTGASLAPAVIPVADVVIAIAADDVVVYLAADDVVIALGADANVVVYIPGETVVTVPADDYVIAA